MNVFPMTAQCFVPKCNCTTTRATAPLSTDAHYFTPEPIEARAQYNEIEKENNKEKQKTN